jgi:hypothetical protein
MMISGYRSHELGDRKMLYEEARYLHLSMFRRCPADNVVDAYVRAHAEIPDLLAVDERQRRTVRLIVARRLDAAGIEPWLRGKRIRHSLSAKIMLLAYLAECDACHPEFARRVPDRWIALANMGSAALTAIFRLMRGRLQKAWYGLV